MANIYSTWNPADKDSNITLSNGNLTATQGVVGSFTTVRSTVSVTTGKWYWEYNIGNSPAMSGVGNASATLSSYIGQDINGQGYYSDNGQKYQNSGSASYGATYTAGDVIGIALDTAGTVTFYKNNSSQGSISLLFSGPFFAAWSSNTNGVAVTANFGASALTYTPPSGYNAGLYTVSNVNSGFFMFR